MVITLLAPESAFGRAVVNLYSCFFHTTQLADLALQDGVPWSRYHTCLADMGGFVLTFPHPTGEGDAPSDTDSDDAGVDERNGRADKPPSLPCVAVIPLSPVQLGTKPPATSAYHGGNWLPSPDHQCSNACFSYLTADIEAGSVDSSSSPSHVRLSRASSSSGSSSDSSSPSSIDLAIATVNPPEATLMGQDNTIYHGRSTVRAFLSGKEWGEAVVRRARVRHIERKTRHYGPVAWRPHPNLVALSKSLISSMTVNGSDSISESTALPRGMTKHHLARTLVTLEGDALPLCAAQLLKARRLGLISQLPYVTEAMLCDRDKSDTLVKLAAVWQTMWLGIDLAVRQASGLPSSPFEIMVLAFAALALMIYLMNWFQPKDVQTPFYIYSARCPTAEELRSLAILAPQGQGLCPGVFSNWSTPSVETRDGYYYYAAGIWGAGMAWSGMVFGSIHLLAWNSAFPTVIEGWLWRASALVTAVWPLIPGMIGWLVGTLQRHLESSCLNRAAIRRFLQATLFPILVIPLLCARLYLLVEAYRSLYYLPPESYVTTWTSNIPRFG